MSNSLLSYSHLFPPHCRLPLCIGMLIGYIPPFRPMGSRFLVLSAEHLSRTFVINTTIRRPEASSICMFFQRRSLPTSLCFLALNSRQGLCQSICSPLPQSMPRRVFSVTYAHFSSWCIFFSQPANHWVRRSTTNRTVVAQLNSLLQGNCIDSERHRI